MKILNNKRGLGFAMVSALFAGASLLIVSLLLGGSVMSALLDNKLLVAIGFIIAITLIGIFRR
jgi:hypothetical protein